MTVKLKGPAPPAPLPYKRWLGNLNINYCTVCKSYCKNKPVNIIDRKLAILRWQFQNSFTMTRTQYYYLRRKVLEENRK